jgi:hypothetical protein
LVRLLLAAAYAGCCYRCTGCRWWRSSCLK